MSAGADTPITSLEAEFQERLDAHAERKRQRNEALLTRLSKLNNAWSRLHTGLDESLKGELEAIRFETGAIAEAKERLKRAVPPAAAANAFAVAGKVTEEQSKIGLPGLTVRVALKIGEKANVAEVKTSRFGDFFAEFPIDPAAGGKASLELTVLGERGAVLHRQPARAVAGRAGSVEHVAIPVKYTGALSDARDYGKGVADGIESDAELVTNRAKNMEESFAAFDLLSKSVRTRLLKLKQELSQAPVPALVMREAPAAAPARFLGNPGSRELHDLEQVKRQCNIDSIPLESREYFGSPEEAQALGYDLCAHCFGRERSTR